MSRYSLIPHIYTADASTVIRYMQYTWAFYLFVSMEQIRITGKTFLSIERQVTKLRH
jgi:hypothetical protein